MKKCVPRTSNRIITILAAIVCVIVAFTAFREAIRIEQPPAIFWVAGILFSGIFLHTIWGMYHLGNWGFFYDEEKIVFVRSRKDRWELRWDKMKEETEKGQIEIYYQSASGIWNFYFREEGKIKQISALPRMAGYDGLIAMLREKEIPVQEAKEGFVCDEEKVDEAYYKAFGRHLYKEKHREK